MSITAPKAKSLFFRPQPRFLLIYLSMIGQPRFSKEQCTPKFLKVHALVGVLQL